MNNHGIRLFVDRYNHISLEKFAKTHECFLDVYQNP